MYWLIGLLRNLISQTNLEFENSKSCGRRQSGSAQPHSFEHRLSSNAIASLELLKPTQRFMKLHTIPQRNAFDGVSSKTKGFLIKEVRLKATLLSCSAELNLNSFIHQPVRTSRYDTP
mmetsp:Transcript_16143/g.23641  ORF Transcript_16143/g.23641 Transcript_16143/m.23641 type:complete len:118 (-) Transcript_16143:65-418(-)